MNDSPNRSLNIAIHALVWIALLSMPHVAAYFSNSTPHPVDAGMFIMPIQLMTLFYINYLWLINKLLFKKRIIAFIGVNALIIAAITLTVMTMRHSLVPPPEFIERRGDNLPLFMAVMNQILVVGLSVAIKMTGKWYQARQRVQELETINTQAELQQLKSQLNPHFLFNSLNNIYALIAFDPEKAQLSLSSLCDMLRYQLYEANRETIPLEKEIEFVRSYCDLMRLRLPKQVKLDVELPEDVVGIAIAPLLFVSIVENAFKHGISQNNDSYISIKISLDNGYTICTVRNSYYPKKDNDRSGSGIGIENLRRRLELLYPDNHSFRTEKIGDEFVAQLTIRTTV